MGGQETVVLMKALPLAINLNFFMKTLSLKGKLLIEKRTCTNFGRKRYGQFNAN